MFVVTVQSLKKHSVVIDITKDCWQLKTLYVGHDDEIKCKFEIPELLSVNNFI